MACAQSGLEERVANLEAIIHGCFSFKDEDANGIPDCAQPSVCGNAICEAGETSATCPQDCLAQPVCGDGICEGGETFATRPEDCP